MTEEIKIGEKAPEFEFINEKNQIVRLSDFSGKKLVLYFYPKDDTPGCTTEALEFTALYAEFKKLNVELYGISQDDISSHEKFKNKYNIGFSLGADMSGTVCSAYNTIKERSIFGIKTKGIVRTTYLIDEEGKIFNIWQKVQAKDHAQEVLNFIKSNQN